MIQGVLASLGKIFLVTLLVAIASSVGSPATALDADASSSVNAESSETTIAQSSDDDDAGEDDGDDDGDDDSDDGDDDDSDDDDDDDSDDEEVELSSSVSTRILQTVAQTANTSISNLRIVRATSTQWSDGCLGLGGPNVTCTQAIVPGYRVLVASATETWVFRTNESGSQVVLDTEATRSLASSSTTTTSEQRVTRTTETRTSQTTQTQFTQAIATSVFQAITSSTQVQASSLRLVSAEQRVWSDSCLGLTAAGQTCTPGNVPGFRVVVASSDRAWVYRTNATGSQVVLDQAATQTLMARMQSQTTTQQTTTTTQVNFSDVSRSYWAYEYIARLAQLNIIEGFPDNTFRPSEAVTKAQYAAILRKAFNKTAVQQAVNFQDVSTSYWAYSAIREAYTMGFFGADSDREFNPTQRLTRLDVLVALARGLNYTNVSTSTSVDTILSTYTDAASIPTNVRPLIAALIERRILVATNNRLDLTRVATRSEVCAFLYQSLVSTGRVEAVTNSTQTQPSGTTETETDDTETETNTETETEVETDTEGGRTRQNCNQGIGNGAEGCDPGNSSPRGGSNDEGGRTPGQRP